MNILLADHNEVFVTGFLALLEPADRDNRIHHLDHGDDILHFLEHRAEVDVILIDRNLPGIALFELLQRLQNRGIETPVIVMSSTPDAVDIQLALESGAMGFVSKTCDSESLLEALNAAILGEKVIFSDFATTPVTRSLNMLTRESESRNRRPTLLRQPNQAIDRHSITA